MQNTFKIWLPCAIVITLMSGLVYLAVQQNMRMSANDPQIQMAEDDARMLEDGALAVSVVGTAHQDISQTLSPFVSVFDDKGNTQESSARLNNQIPIPPQGVFAYTASHGEDRFTWEPTKGVRMATVMKKVGGQNPGYVLVGRSLREVEDRENQLGIQVLSAWIVSLILTYIACMWTRRTR